MEIVIRSFAMIREIMNSSKIILEIDKEDNIVRVIDKFVNKYPRTKQYLYTGDSFSKRFVIAINGSEIAHDQFNSTTLTSGDELAIVPPAGGG